MANFYLEGQQRHIVAEFAARRHEVERIELSTVDGNCYVRTFTGDYPQLTASRVERVR